ncbi:hypothetical protein E4P42_24570 [Mycobacterium sp. PS03-16]|uniref:LppA family lipoprotein n=1 Tax=Mycobacterium sp. PS03-16 TaxID=2559611 RepID=UPI001073752E|nr:LppA family lipoprotein [Mycobacterium sp. PS03-16]TFV54898.1 hypothetical protein E4P42_24570 [Mycobacterium sp. PS03-16]
MTDTRAGRTRARVAALLLCGALTPPTGGCTMSDHPNESPTVAGEDKVALIDGLRDKGSFEEERRRLNDTATVIAERIVAAVPGQTWRVTDDPNVLTLNRNGQSCDDLTADIARRPSSDSVAFGRTFTADEFTTAVGIVREEAARLGATEESSLFDETAKRDFDVRGNGYEVNLGQITAARLNITGGCRLLQSVLDLPPGQLPPEPPIVPTP